MSFQNQTKNKQLGTKCNHQLDYEQHKETELTNLQEKPLHIRYNHDNPITAKVRSSLSFNPYFEFCRLHIPSVKRQGTNKSITDRKMHN